MTKMTDLTDLEEAVDASREPLTSVAAIRALAGENKRIAFVSGNFNAVHPGHLRLLRFAAENADILVVGINPDTTPGVTVPQPLRQEGIEAISLVSYAVALTGTPEEFVAELRPDVVVKGKEFAERENPEKPIVEGYGGKLIFSSGEVRFSSISLLQRDYAEPNFHTIKLPADYPFRHGFDNEDLKGCLDRFTGLRVLVIGDLIVDKYINCDPLGMSQEDPTIVVTPIEHKTFVGGAGIVAAHAQGLGANVRFMSVVGDDEAARYAEEALGRYNVKLDLFLDRSRPTTLKERYRANGKTLLRVNHLRQHAIESDLQARILKRVEDVVSDVDLILFSDFNYGMLPQPLVEAIAALAARHKVMMGADSQSSSQLADISRFKGMDIVTPTEREARLALRDFESGLVIVAERLREVARAGSVVVTLGSEGLLIHGSKDGIERSDRLPAFNTAPKDAAGAGDSLFTTLSMALCAGVDIWRGTYLGSVAAACQVSRVGNTPLTRQDLIMELEQATVTRA